MSTQTSQWHKITDVICFVPLLFAMAFGWLILRAHFAFGAWPRMSGDDPWALVNRAPADQLHPVFSYANHIDVVYLLMLLTLVSALVFAVMTLMTRRISKGPTAFFAVGMVGTVSLLAWQNGRFLFWFLD